MKKWEGKNVLVTGFGGFVGTAMARYLVDAGANVVGLTSAARVSWPSNAEGLFPCNVVRADITDYKSMCSVISRYEIDVIFHFAAYAIVRISARDPMTTYNVNVMGTAALLEAARNVGRCSDIIVASSDKAYGDHDELPYREDFALQPKNTYDTSKACMDMLARSYAKNYGMPIKVTRSSNIYGPGDMNMSRLIPNTIMRLLKGESPRIYTDIENMQREFIYIDDVVRACDVLVGAGQPGEAYNIGGTGAWKIRDVIELIMEITGKDVPLEVQQRDPEFKEIEKQWIDATKLEALGWKPLISLDEGLKRTVQWYWTMSWADQ